MTITRALIATFCTILLASGAAAVSTVGKFGNGYDGVLLRSHAIHRAQYSTLPITAECWFKADSASDWSIMLANRSKTSTLHWEMYVGPDGTLGAYIPGFTPSTISTTVQVANGTWRHAALVLTSASAKLYSNGSMVANVNVTANGSQNPATDEGPLYVGQYKEESLHFHGVIDEVRISGVARSFSGAPIAAYTTDASTIGLWHFEEDPDGGSFADSSSLANPFMVAPPQEQADIAAFGVTTNPFNRTMSQVNWSTQSQTTLSTGESAGAEELLIHGSYDCIYKTSGSVSESNMLNNNSYWNGSLAANVPCTVQTALFQAGKISDPVLLKNDLDIDWARQREWWLRKTFTVPVGWQGKKIRLSFDGVDYVGKFWLNGQLLGSHTGMFGGPDFDATSRVIVGGSNTLVVKISPAPSDWTKTMKSSVGYGWHYVKLITLGIWRPVRLQARGSASMDHPFLTCKAIEGSSVRTKLSLDIDSSYATSQSLTFTCKLTPRNFAGSAFSLSKTLAVSPGHNEFGLEGLLDGARLWWPVDLGDPNLYRMDCTLQNGSEVLDRFSCNWGARVLEMGYTANAPKSAYYKWQYIVNGVPVWIKGANWCYPDPMFRLDRTRQARFLTMAKVGHVQLLRVWGGGPVENDEFYDLCDELGIMVQQEYPVHGQMQFASMSTSLAADTAVHQVKRLRNRPSLITWIGSNESPTDNSIHYTLGKYSLELDGTRPFRRSCPYGGDGHHHIYWGRMPLLDYRDVAPAVIAETEFGFSSPADMETLKRVLPSSEWSVWPAASDSVFVHHTPTFDVWHVDTMTMYANEFLNPTTLPELVKGMQLAQGLGTKYMIESMRIRKPETSATYFYKLTEDYPGSSWSTIDYYGYPKRAHYMLSQAYRPTHVMAIFDSAEIATGSVPVGIYAVNDTGTSISGSVEGKLYNGNLGLLSTFSYTGKTFSPDAALSLGNRYISSSTKPLFLCLRMLDSTGKELDRNWYYFDYAAARGSLFNRPATTLTAQVVSSDGVQYILVTNTGALPALSVEFGFGADGDVYFVEDSGLWLYPGEQKRVRIYKTPAADGRARGGATLTVSAWNAGPINCVVPDPGEFQIGATWHLEHVGRARDFTDGEWVAISGSVTGTFAEGVVYVQSADRSSGIRVDANLETALSEGQQVSVEGMMVTQNGERAILATRITL